MASYRSPCLSHEGELSTFSLACSGSLTRTFVQLLLLNITTIEQVSHQINTKLRYALINGEI